MPPPTTNFVQDYALKRQQQLDRAKQIREERLAKQQQQQEQAQRASAAVQRRQLLQQQKKQQEEAEDHMMYEPDYDQGGVDDDHGGNEEEFYRQASPYGGGIGSQPTPASPSVRQPPQRPSRASASTRSANAPPPTAVLQVAEDDFKRATQAGIITPDQSRQLWAMLSNQIIRVAPPSSHGGGSPNPHASTGGAGGTQYVTPSALGALSHTSSLSSTMSSAAFAHFSKSVTMESLRQSIAQFKAEQQQQQQQGRPSKPGAAGAAGARQQAVASSSAKQAPPPSQKRHWYEESDEQPVGAGHPAYEEEEYFNPEDVEEQFMENLRGGGDDGGGGGDGKRRKLGAGMTTASPPPASKSRKPVWNDDIEVRYNDLSAEVGGVSGGGGGVSSGSSSAAAKKRRPGDRVVSKRPVKAPPTTTSSHSGGTSASHLMSPEDQVGSPPTRNSAKQPSRQSATAKKAATTARSREVPPPTPYDERDLDGFDDRPVGGGGFVPLDDLPVTAAKGGSDINEQLKREAMMAAKIPLRACRCCGREFRQDIVARHEATCQKVSKPRRAFDMKQQRLDGLEGIEEAKRNAKYNAPPPSTKPKNVMPKWKIQHEQFQAAMKAAHGGGGGVGGGAPPPQAPDDRVPCPHCGRKFDAVVAERHIPHCANTVNKPKGLSRPIRR